jgi:hypothetical protein
MSSLAELDDFTAHFKTGHGGLLRPPRHYGANVVVMRHYVLQGFDFGTDQSLRYATLANR